MERLPAIVRAAILLGIVALASIAILLITGDLAFGYPAPKLDKPLPPPVIDVGDVVEHIGTHDRFIVVECCNTKSDFFPDGYFWVGESAGRGQRQSILRAELVRFSYRPSTKRRSF